MRQLVLLFPLFWEVMTTRIRDFHVSIPSSKSATSLSARRLDGRSVLSFIRLGRLGLCYRTLLFSGSRLKALARKESFRFTDSDGFPDFGFLCVGPQLLCAVLPSVSYSF